MGSCLYEIYYRRCCDAVPYSPIELPAFALLVGDVARQIATDMRLFKPDIPTSWLTDKCKYKEFSKKSAIPHSQKVAGVVAFNQLKFVGKENLYREIFETLGFPVSGNYISRGYLITIFVITANENIFKESTKNIVGTWGTSKNRGKVIKSFVDAVKKAERDNDIAYAETFKLFKFLFPRILN